jgi:hypothetical protein
MCIGEIQYSLIRTYYLKKFNPFDYREPFGNPLSNWLMIPRYFPSFYLRHFLSLKTT